MIAGLILGAVVGTGLYGEHPRLDCVPHLQVAYLRGGTAYLADLGQDSPQAIALGAGSDMFPIDLEDGYVAWTGTYWDRIVWRWSDGTLHEVHLDTGVPPATNRATVAMVGGFPRVASQCGLPGPDGICATGLNLETSVLVTGEPWEPKYPAGCGAGVVYADDYRDGTSELAFIPWGGGEPQRITESAAVPGSPDVVQEKDGVVWLTWTEWATSCPGAPPPGHGYCSTWIASRSPAGEWSAPQRIQSGFLGESEWAAGPRIAVGPGGLPVVVWSTFEPLEAGVWMWHDGKSTELAAGRRPDVCSGPGGVVIGWTDDATGEIMLMADDQEPEATPTAMPTATPMGTAQPTATAEPQATPTPVVEVPGDLPPWLAMLIALLLALLSGGLIR